MIWNSFRCAVWVMLAFLLVSCQFMPTQTGNQKPIAADVRPAFGTKADNSGQSQTLIFPSQVTPQTFALINKPDAKGKFWWVRFTVAKEIYPKPAQTEISGDDEDDDSDERAEEKSEDADHDDRPATHRIWIPENGNFKVNLVAGSRFQVIDSDARDQEATVQVPTALLSTYLRLEGPKSKESKKNKPAIERKLTLVESLYNVNQTVSRIGPEREGKRDRDEQKQPWLKLGNRPFPVPTSWSSPEGQKYVLNFSNQGVQRFVTRWYRAQTGAQLDYPVGLKEIGPAGGMVELPGVAKLEIPAGAIETPTVVKITQMLQVEANNKKCQNLSDVSPGTCLPGYDFITPVVKLEPFGLKLNSPARLLLPTDAVRVGNNSPYMIEHTASETAKSEEWYFSPYLTSLGNSESQASIQDEIGVKQFVYVAKQFPSDVTPDQGATVEFFEVEFDSGFTIQQQAQSSKVNFRINNKSQGSDLEIKKTLQAATKYFRDKLGLKPPVPWKEVPPSGKKFIPVVLNELPVPHATGNGVDYGSAQTWWLPQTLFSLKYLGTDITLSRCANATDCDIPATLEAAAHELFHVIEDGYYLDQNNQYGHLTKQHYEDNLGRNDSHIGKDNWVDESIASYMGASFVTNQLKPPGLFLLNLLYAGWLIDSQSVLPISLHQHTSFYHGNAFFTDLAAQTGGGLQGDQIVANVIKAYGKQLEEDDNKIPAYTTRGLKALNDTLDLPQAYTNYAVDAYQSKNINLFDTQYKIPQPPVNQVVDIDSTHTQSNPKLFDVTADNLGTQIVQLNPSASLSDATLVVKFKNQSNGSYVDPSQIPVPGEPDLSAASYFSVNAFPLNDKSEVISTASLGSTGVTVSHFGSSGSTRSLVLGVSNTVNVLKDKTPIKGYFEVYVDSPPAPPPSLQWISINPNGVPSFIVRRPGVCALSGLQLVNFTYINPTTGEDAVPQEPMSVTLTTELGTGTYPLLRVVPRPNIPPAHAVYTAWVDECAYQDGFNMYGVATATVPYRRSFRGTFTLVDAAGNRSNTVDMNWAVFP